MKRIKQRVISFVLALVMSFALMPAFSVYADDEANLEDMMDFLYELTMNIDDERTLTKEINWKMVEVSFKGADKAGAIEKLLKIIGKNVEDKSMRELLEMLEKTGGSEVFKVLDSVRNFHEAYGNIDGVIKAYNDHKDATNIYGETEATARAFANAFKLFSTAVKTAAPGLGHLISIPIEIGTKLLEDPIPSIIKKIKNHRWSSVLAIVDTDPRLALELAEAYGLRNEFDQLMEERLELQKQIDALRKYIGLNEDYIKLYDALYGTNEWREVSNQLNDVNNQMKVINDETDKISKALETLVKYGKENGLIDENGDYIENKGDEAAKNGVNDLDDDKNNAQKQSCPLTINIDGSGIKTLPLNEGVYFDHQGNGFKIKTGWVAPSSGLLVRDINGNGEIDSGRELFGDNTLLKNGKLAANGFEALKDLNESDDGIFDERSAAYHELHLWFDRNGNGWTGPGELITLSEAGVVSIDLNYSNSDYVDANGNAFRQISTGMLYGGIAVEVVDIWFARDVKDSRAVDWLKVSEEIAVLPQIRGFGTTHSLQQAMMLDGSGQLQALVEQFIAEEDETVRRNLVPQIIHKWTGKTTNLAAMEALTGTKYTGGTTFNAVAIINRGFDKFAGIIYEVLMSQSHYRYLYDQMIMGGSGDAIDFSLIADELLRELAADQEAGEKFLVNYMYNLHMLMIINDVNPVTFQDRIVASGVRAAIYVEAMNRKPIWAVDGNSKLTGSAVGDIFLVYSGGNTIVGSYGDNIYIFGKDSGANAANDIGGNNTIMLPVNRSDFTARPADKDVELIAGNCTITLTGLTNGASYTIIFADGSTYDLLDLLEANEIHTAEDLINARDNLYGFYRLASDIDLSGIEWMPVGTTAMPFGGLFDGNGYEIKNLGIALGESDYVGLFGVNRGTIRKVKLTGVKITGRDYTGGLAGKSDGTIIDCSVSGDVAGRNRVGVLAGYTSGRIADSGAAGTVTGTEYNTGGLVGYMSGGLVERSSASVNVSASSFVGGLTGYMGSDSRIIDSGATGNVSSGDDAGGFVGYMSGGMIERSYATGNVSSGKYSGGFAGFLYNATLKNCFATGNVTKASYTAGLLGGSHSVGVVIENCYTASNNDEGLHAGIATVRNSYYNKDLAPYAGKSDYGRTTAEMTKTETYSGWDFENVWVMGENGYPLLRGIESAGADWIEISTAEQLDALRDNLPGNYRLASDIDLSGIEWMPVGTTAMPFGGVFDGNGYEIKNLGIVLSESDYVGLFGVNRGTIRKVKLTGVKITGRDYTGGLAGRSDGTIIDCSVSGDVAGRNRVGVLAGHTGGRIADSGAAGTVTGTEYVGGLVGYMSGGMVERSSASVNVSASLSVGGLAGYMSSDSRIIHSGATGTVAGKTDTGGFVGKMSGVVERSYATGTVAGKTDTGGFVGEMSGGMIERSCATGNVSSGNRSGGFAGCLNNATLKNCFATGNVTKASYTAGLVGGSHSAGVVIENCYTASNNDEGLHVGEATVRNSYYNKDLAPYAGKSDYGRTTEEMAKTETYSGWDFENIWVMGEAGYPILCGFESVAGAGWIEISTAEQLDAVRGNPLGNYRLVSDIDLSGMEWMPIGTTAMPFAGLFDGNGYEIKNLTVVLSESDYVGLFGVNRGTISNMKLTGVKITGRDYTGGVAGRSDGVIVNCSVSGDIVGKHYLGVLTGYTGGRIADADAAGTVTGISHAGGLVGYMSRGMVERSSASVNVFAVSHVMSSASASAGGLVGYMNTGSRIADSSATGTVASDDNTGGFVGWIDGGLVERSYATGQVLSGMHAGGFVGKMSSGMIERSYATGNVSSGSDSGGFVGRLNNATLKNCFATGNVTKASSTAGFAGYSYDSRTVIENCYTVSSHDEGLHAGPATVRNSYYNKDLAPYAGKSEYGRTTAEMAKTETYSGWDFENVWVMGEAGYPILRGFESVTGASWIEISTAEQLDAVRGNLLGNYRLVSDIDLSGMEWLPIGTTAMPFGGLFNGNGYEIKNLTIALSESDYVGLFGVNRGTIRNVKLTGVKIIGRDYTGGLVGRNGGFVIDCSVSGDVAGRTYTGGLVGEISGGRVERSLASVNVSAGSSVGGLTGYMSSNSRIIDSGATGTVAGKTDTGGFIGKMSTGMVERSYATGNVSSGNCSGGFAGCLNNATLKNCFATGNVTKASFTAGFAGYSYGSGTVIENCYTISSHNEGLHAGSATVRNSYYNKDLAPYAGKSEYGRTTAEMAKTETYLGWDFENVWIMGEAGYPLLRGVKMPQGLPMQRAGHVNVSIINESGMPVEIISDRQESGLFFVGDTLMLKAIPGDEWVFAEWQDENGNTVSTDIEYSFVITGDITLILVAEVTENLKETDESEADSELIIESEAETELMIEPEEEADESFTADENLSADE